MTEYPGQTYSYEIIKKLWFLTLEFHIGKGLYLLPTGLVNGGFTSISTKHLDSKQFYYSKKFWIGGMGWELYLGLSWKD